MKCRVVKGLIPLFVGGDLPGRLADRLSDHLAGCEGCAAECRALEASQHLVRRVALTDRPPDLPRDFAVRVCEEIAAAGSGREKTFGRIPATGWVVWATAAVLLLAGVGLLNGYLRLQRETLPVSVAAQREATSPEEVAATEESKAEESPEVTRAQMAGLMSRLNPHRDMTDEELDAKYPVVESVSQPEGTAMVYRTQDPRITVVWILEPAGSETPKGDDVR